MGASDSEDDTPQTGRRVLLKQVSTAAMFGGLAAGYGYCGSIGARYVYPRDKARTRLYVTDVASVAVGETVDYQTPSGARVAITRRGEGEADFIALSSTCPHLGCQVHWEGKNNRYFCPCHNGAFDAEGRPLSGPPQADGTALVRYPLAVDKGLLFIELAEEDLA
jgi:Rieske Fe-S protein